MNPRNCCPVLMLVLLLILEAPDLRAEDIEESLFRVTTTDGTTVTGVLDLESLRIETSVGVATVKTRDLTSVQAVEGNWEVVTRNGSRFVGKIAEASWKISGEQGEFSVKWSQVQSLRWTSTRRVKGPAAPPPAAGPPAGTPLVKPANTFVTGDGFRDLCVSPDGKSVYLLTCGVPHLIILGSGTFEKRAETRLKGEEEALRLLPDGKTIVACGKQRMTALDAASGQVLKSFEIEHPMSFPCALDSDSVAVLADGALEVVSLSKQCVVFSVPGVRGRSLQARPDGQKLYASGGSVALKWEDTGRWEGGFTGFAAGEVPVEFQLAPNGQQAVSKSGDVYRVGRSIVCDMLPYGKIASHDILVFLPSRQRALALTQSGAWSEWRLDSCVSERSSALGMWVFRAVADENSRSLFILGRPNTAGSARDFDGRDSAKGGFLYRFELP